MPSVLLADDHPLFRDALSAAVSRILPDAALFQATTVAEAQQVLSAEAIDLLLLDLHMPDSEGFAGLIALRHDYPALPVVVVSASDGPGVANRAISLGASGFISKSASMDTLCDSLQAVLGGDLVFPEGVGDSTDSSLADVEKLASLTPAQVKVLLGMRAGLLNKQIAYECNITEATVKAHVTAIFRKLDVTNRTQAVLVAESLDVDRPAAS